MPRKTLACVTMAYNEGDMLPLWLRHYGGQVGLRACYVIDHGSNDGSTDNIGLANRLPLARSALNEPARAAFVGQVCAGLLRQYDYVAFTDTDEMLVADPARWNTLLDYVNDAPPKVTTAFGMNLLHLMGHEREWRPSQRILAQRNWVFAFASMCKPSLIGRPVSWSPGFHSADAPIVFNGLFLFHLAYFDYGISMRRQQKRRSQAFADDATAAHHREGEQTVQGWMEGWSRMPRDESMTLDQNCPSMTAFYLRLLVSKARREGGDYPFDLNIWNEQLWRVPERFAGSF